MKSTLGVGLVGLTFMAACESGGLCEIELIETILHTSTTYADGTNQVDIGLRPNAANDGYVVRSTGDLADRVQVSVQCFRYAP
ncbi:MAG: hypothetical protein AAGA56_04070 [Myxococcota bacterium]